MTLSTLTPAAKAPMRLWDDERYERVRGLMAVVDRLNERFGRDTVRVGMRPTAGRWRTRFGRRSPRYTTKWAEILAVG